MMQIEKKMQVTILGNSNSGKSAFLSHIIKTNNKMEMKVNRESTQCRIMEKNYSITILEVNGIQKEEEKKIEYLVKKSDLAIIIFDISNQQSFMDARNWVNFAKNIVEAKNLALLAHKIDLDAARPLSLIIDFANINHLQLFFSSAHMNCKKVFEDIILWSQCNSTSQDLAKELESQPKKSQGLIDKLIGIGKSAKPEEDAIRNKVKHIYQSSLTRLNSLRKCLRQALLKNNNQLNSMKNKLKEICQVQQTKKQQYNFDDLLKILNDKLRQSSQDKFELAKKEGEIKNLTFQIQTLTQTNSDLTKKLKLEKLQHQKVSKQLDQLNKKYEEAKLTTAKQIKVLKETVEQLEKQVVKAEYEVTKTKQELWRLDKQKNECAVSKVNVDSELNVKAAQFAANLRVLQDQLKVKQVNQKFWQIKALRKLDPSYFTKLRQMLEKKSTKPIALCEKLYQFYLCSNKNFHSFIDGHENLLYVISLKQFVLIIYAPQKLKTLRCGKLDFALIWDFKNQLQSLEIDPNAGVWKYDPISLVFGMEQLSIKFRPNSCWMRLKNRKVSFISHKANSLQQILGLQERQNRDYQIVSLQIFKIRFQ